MSLKRTHTLLLDDTACYVALLARDSRFDGRFFCGVSSTGIYCRPICRVKPPKEENCSFFISAAAAEAAGYRPCLRCRPELAPGLAPMDSVARLARIATLIMEEDLLADCSISDLAAMLGITDRHLRRVFAAEYGISPVQYLRTRRLLLAKILLTDTRLRVTDVAMTAGFDSIRRFNDLFKKRYRLTPGGSRSEEGACGDVVGRNAGLGANMESLALLCNHYVVEFSQKSTKRSKKELIDMKYTCTVETPLGTMTAAAEEGALIGLWFIGQKYYPAETAAWITEPDYPVFKALRSHLSRYFAGQNIGHDIVLAPHGSLFRKNVWDLLLKIPFGEIVTYGEIAQAIARAGRLASMSAQAVGGAVGHNPISILIPCHRVVGVNRSLTGYAGGLDKKEALLRLEGVSPVWITGSE